MKNKSIFKHQCDCGECFRKDEEFPFTTFFENFKDADTGKYCPEPEKDWEWTSNFFEEEIKKLCSLVVSHWAYSQWPRLEEDGNIYLTTNFGRAKIDLEFVLQEFIEGHETFEDLLSEDCLKTLIPFRKNLVNMVSIIDEALKRVSNADT